MKNFTRIMLTLSVMLVACVCAAAYAYDFDFHTLVSGGAISLAMAPTLTPIIKGSVKSRMGGNQAVMYIIPANLIATEPVLPANPTTDKEKVTAVGSWTFSDVAVKGFRKVELQTDSVGFNFETVGPEDCNIFKQGVSGNLIGLEDDVTALMADSNSQEYVGVLLEPSNKRKIIGSKAYPFKIKFKMGDSKKLEDGLLVGVEISAFSQVPIVRYDGVIPIHPDTNIPALIV